MTDYWCSPTVTDLRLGSATFGTAAPQEHPMPTDERDGLQITPVSPPVAMHLTAYGDEAEASIRQMCSGAMPSPGQRYVWVCTGVTTTDGRVQADFQLVPLAPAVDVLPGDHCAD